MSTHAELIKLIIAYTLVGAFVFTVVITCFSLVGLVRFADRKQQNKLFSVLIVELVALGLGSFADLLELNPVKARASIEAPLQQEVVQAEATNDVIASKLQATALEGLRPVARQAARDLIAAARDEGIEAGVISGYRSPADQLKAYAQGRTARGPMITNARVTVHSTGLAFDVAVYRDGRPVFENVPEYQRLGAIGRRLGLVWGGDWKPFPDYPHFETPGAKAVRQDMERSSQLGGG